MRYVVARWSYSPAILSWEFWNEVVNFDALVRFGTIDEADLGLFLHTDSIDEAYEFLVKELTEHALGIPGPVL